MTKNVIKSTKAHAQAGFSLVELMVVVTIIGILAGIAMPKFQTFRARAQQTEAKSGLNGLFMAASSFQANYNEFPGQAASGAPPAALNAFAAGAQPRYTYRYITDAATNAAGFTAVATSNQRIANNSMDVWRINTNKWLCSPYNAVDNDPATAQAAVKVATVVDGCPVSVNGPVTAPQAATYIPAADAP